MHQELCRIAHSRLRSSADFTLLNTTALAQESYLRFLQNDGLRFGRHD